ncbi:desulfoferrodoxin [Desulfospira joergensenii]|uniref:desulfoferrodoxin n=1 Tax=Desulfospira joergensenii TaxID=53329 RepID=UPI0003B2F280|nr:desulfoferrodoxin [Desulfospira joergensenii]
MAEKKQIYKCDICGNMVEVIDGGDGDLVCCGQNMALFEEKTEDQGKEKHVPVVEAVAEGIKVTVGSNPHPMEEDHFIQWIEAIDGEDTCRHYLKPGQDPQTLFKNLSPDVQVREFCNVHGLWKA